MLLSKKNIPEFKPLSEKILQFGEGNFLRCFVDWMIHQLNKHHLFDGSVVVVQPIEKGMVDLLEKQDCIYTVLLKGIQNGKIENIHEIVTSISRGINPYTQFGDFLKTAQQPEMRYLLSNTTESGIAYKPDDTIRDTPPASYPAKLTIWLYYRFQYFKGDISYGVHIIPCELTDKNASLLKKFILQLIEDWKLEADFREWILTACFFHNTLVDRIVPGFPREQYSGLVKELGYEDQQMVEGEPFHLWVIESDGDTLPTELPFPSAGLNVLYVKDVTPYKVRKVRILNGVHTALVPVAYLYGIDTVRESMEDEVTGVFIRNALFQEIIPTLDLPEAELNVYAQSVLERFANPFIRHQLMSISLNSWSKFETRVLPSILEYINRKNALPERLTFSLAATIAFYRGIRGDEKIVLKDDADLLELLVQAWCKYDGTDDSITRVVTDVLAYEKNWKMDLNSIEGLTEKVRGHLVNIMQQGMKAAITTVL
jgi:tagaturonate reductase